MGQQRSTMTNQTQLVILEFDDLGHQTGSFNPSQFYANVGQLKVNNNMVICQMSIMLPAMFDQNPPHTFDKIVEKQITTKKMHPRMLIVSVRIYVFVTTL